MEDLDLFRSRKMTKTLSKTYEMQARRIENLEEQINAISIGMNKLEVLSALTHIIQDIITEMKAEVVPLWESE
jgi:CII-binding regulator of phage lambda lysogenization HflD